MGLRRITWIAIVLAAIGFALLNLHCWWPGIGGRTDRVNEARPAGSEVELYYGWPACYRAELLRSDDPGLGDELLDRAPFFLPPYAQASLAVREFDWSALALDVSFALLAVMLLALLIECFSRGRMSRREMTMALGIGLALSVEYWLGPMLDAHL
jgi:hypothetical protein